MDTAKKILEIQSNFNILIDELAKLLKLQFDISINITILKILFREEKENILDMELQMVEMEIEYMELHKIDKRIIQIQTQLDLLSAELDKF